MKSISSLLQRSELSFIYSKLPTFLAWPSAFPHADNRAAANCGISLAPFKAARNSLLEARVIFTLLKEPFTPKKTKYRICKCNEYPVSEQAPLNSKALKKKKV